MDAKRLKGNAGGIETVDDTQYEKKDKKNKSEKKTKKEKKNKDNEDNKNKKDKKEKKKKDKMKKKENLPFVEGVASDIAVGVASEIAEVGLGPSQGGASAVANPKSKTKKDSKKPPVPTGGQEAADSSVHATFVKLENAVAPHAT
jgi:hypothetical protein